MKFKHKLVKNIYNVASPGFPRQLFQRWGRLDLSTFPQPLHTFPSLTPTIRKRKGCRAPTLLRASGSTFSEGRNQKSARKSRMAILLLFLPLNAVIHHCCLNFLRYLQNALSSPPPYSSQSTLAFLLLFPFNRWRRRVQRHFPRLSQEESGLSSDP